MSDFKQYLYILHSKDFDIDGIDTCYKFGVTEDITRRKFDSCYQTALKYPCFYKYWYDLKIESGIIYEKIIKHKLKKYRYINNDEMTYGTEMFCCSLETLRNIVIKTLNERNVEYIENNVDNFIEQQCITNEILDNENIEQIEFVYNIIKKITKKENLNDDEKQFLKELSWIFEHYKCDNNKHMKCMLCNRNMEKTSFYCYNKKYDIKAFIGSTCIKKCNNTTFFNTQVEQKIKNMGFNKNIIKDSDSSIINIIKDASYLLYSYILNDNNSDNTEVKTIHIDDNILDKIINTNDIYDPNSCICMILSYMYRKGNTYMLENEINDEIEKWNEKPDRYWNINIIIKYIKNKKHDFLEYDLINKIFISTKYRKLEKQFIKYWKKLDIVDTDININQKKELQENYYLYIKEKYGYYNNEEGYAKLMFESILKNRISILSGVAGSGKSSLSAFICKEFHSNYNIIQLAPTGKAMSVIKEKNKEHEKKGNYMQLNVSTIHSFLYNKNIQNKFIGIGKNKILFHIDEASMIDLKLFTDLLEIIIKLSKLYDSVKILISGDHNQLKPVSFGTPYKHLTRIIKNKQGIYRDYIPKPNNNLIKLDQNLRVEKSNFIYYKLSDFFLKESSGHQTISRFIENNDDNDEIKKKIREINYDYVNELIKKNYQIITYNNSIRNNINYYYKNNKQKSFKEIDMNEITKGDKIMIRKNGYSKDGNMLYYNGQEGIIDNIKKNDKNQITSIILTSIEEENDKNQTISIIFLPKHLEMNINKLISYSWCKTIHNTQGDSFHNVCIILDGTNIDYTSLNTAITRTVKNIEILYNKDWYNKIINNCDAVNKSFLKYEYTGNNFKINSVKKNIIKNLIQLLGKYNYGHKFQIEHNIKMSSNDLNFIKDGYGCNKLEFIKLYRETYK